MMYVPVLLSAAIVEELEQTTDNSMGTYIIHYSIELIEFSAEYTLLNNCNFNLVYRYSLSVNLTIIYYSVTVTRCCSYSCFVLPKMGDSETRNM